MPRNANDLIPKQLAKLINLNQLSVRTSMISKYIIMSSVNDFE